MRRLALRSAIPLVLLAAALTHVAAAQGMVMRGPPGIEGLTITPAVSGEIDLQPNETRALSYSLAWAGNATLVGRVETVAPRELAVAVHPTQLELEPNASVVVVLDVTVLPDAKPGTAYNVPLIVQRAEPPGGSQPHMTTVCVGHDCPPPEGTMVYGGGPAGPGTRELRSERAPPSGDAPKVDDAYAETPGAGMTVALAALAVAAIAWRRRRA